MDSAPRQFFPPHHQLGLFRSPAWQQAWRQHWSDTKALKPLRSINDEQPEFYRYWHVKHGLPMRTVIPAGISTAPARSMRAEYFCFPPGPEKVEHRVHRYLEAALRYRWDQLDLPDLLADSTEHWSLLQAARNLGLYVTEQKRETAYAVDLREQSFSDYVASRGKNTRLKLYNRRTKVAQQGALEINNIWPDRATFYDLLNKLHQARWGKPVYAGRGLAFIDSLLTGLADAGHKVDLSVMYLSGTPISAALDITAHGRCYNVQSGFVEDLIKGVSLGTLHFGYQIEAAFEAGAEVYDFMAGAGKNSQYKASLANTQHDLVSLRLVRNPALKVAYKWRDRSSQHRAETLHSGVPDVR